jgi:hypothetical protein
MSTTYVTTALQAKDTTKGRLRDRLIDEFRVITKESHIESSDCLKMQTEEKAQKLKTAHNDKRLDIEKWGDTGALLEPRGIMVEALLATTPPSLIPAQLITNEPCVVLTNWPSLAKWCKVLHLAIIRQLLPSLEQSGSLRCSKMTCKGSRIGRDLFSSCIVGVWFPVRPASWSPWREGLRMYSPRFRSLFLAGW